MPTTDDKKAEALYLIDVARDILPETASTEDVIAAAKKLGTFINEDTETAATVEAVAAQPEVKRVEFWRVEYKNRRNDGTHWGKPYKTGKGAGKNSMNSAFLRAVRFVETD